jgi:hypothetical protein
MKHAIVAAISILLLSGGDQPTDITNYVTLSVTPQYQSLNVGDIFPAEIRLNTQAYAVAAVAANILFPGEILEVTSIDTNNSSFSLQVENLAQDNLLRITRGEVSPGVKSANALVAQVFFRARAPGTAQVSFELNSPGAGPSRVIAADGFGTDILQVVLGASYKIMP